MHEAVPPQCLLARHLPKQQAHRYPVLEDGAQIRKRTAVAARVGLAQVLVRLGVPLARYGEPPDEVEVRHTLCDGEAREGEKVRRVARANERLAQVVFVQREVQLEELVHGRQCGTPLALEPFTEHAHEHLTDVGRPVRFATAIGKHAVCGGRRVPRAKHKRAQHGHQPLGIVRLAVLRLEHPAERGGTRVERGDRVERGESRASRGVGTARVSERVRAHAPEAGGRLPRSRPNSTRTEVVCARARALPLACIAARVHTRPCGMHALAPRCAIRSRPHAPRT